MDKITKYQSIIYNILQRYDYQSDRIQSLFLADKEKHHYQLLTVGLDKRNAYYLWVRLHLQIKEDGKVWLLENRTEYNIADELIAEGNSRYRHCFGNTPRKCTTIYRFCCDVIVFTIIFFASTKSGKMSFHPKEK